MKFTEEEIDELVEKWHLHNAGPGLTLSEYIRSETGWTQRQYERWVATGEISVG